MSKLSDHHKRIRVFLNDKDKKPIFQLLKEVFELWFLKKRFPLHYFGRFLYRKDIKNHKEYLDMHEYFSIIHLDSHNQKEYSEILQNKLSFSLFCKENNIPTPELFGYNMGKMFFYKGTKKIVHSNADLKVFLKDLLNSQNQNKIFVKTLSDYGGKGVFMIDVENLNQQVDMMGGKILKSAAIFQEAITQHPEVSKIYPNSVNTLRIDTYIDNNRESHAFSVTMRIGAKGSNIDNISSGGFFVPINQETYRLTKHGFQAMIFGGEKYETHPDTQFVFEGFDVPYAKEAKELCIELSNCIPNKLVGWDIAITNTGPLVIEGNNQPYILMGEMGYGGYAKHPLFKEILNNVKAQI